MATSDTPILMVGGIEMEYQLMITESRKSQVATIFPFILPASLLETLDFEMQLPFQSSTNYKLNLPANLRRKSPNWSLHRMRYAPR